jgi:CSLREA domain-containing protein
MLKLSTFTFIIAFSLSAFAQTRFTKEEQIKLAPNAVFVVNSLADTNDLNTNDGLCLDSSNNCTLRAAIQQANATAGTDDIGFALVSPATINLTIGELLVTDSVNITGLGARNLTVQRSTVAGTGNFRIFTISTGMVTISGVTISNGYAVNSGGGGISNGFGLNLVNVVVKNNLAEIGGGGIYSSRTVTISGSTISNNKVVATARSATKRRLKKSVNYRTKRLFKTKLQPPTILSKNAYKNVIIRLIYSLES